MPTIDAALTIENLAAIFPPVAQLLVDDTVTEIMLVGDPARGVLLFFERSGKLFTSPVPDLDLRSLDRLCYAVARPLGAEPRRTPLIDARLEDGSRVALCVPPAARAPAVTIRRFSKTRLTGKDLVESGSVPDSVFRLLVRGLRAGRNVLVAGGTGSGKTTLLNALIGEFPMEDRLVVIEDVIELRVDQPNTVRLEARGCGALKVTPRDMVKHALRHRPDHIVLGEIRGAEAQDVIQALNTGHGGSLTTIHANTAVDALSRVAACASQAEDALPWEIVAASVVTAFELVVHQARRPDRSRGISEVVRVTGYDKVRGHWKTESLWKHRDPAQASAQVAVPEKPAAAAASPPSAAPVPRQPSPSAPAPVPAAARPASSPEAPVPVAHVRHFPDSVPADLPGLPAASPSVPDPPPALPPVTH